MSAAEAASAQEREIDPASRQLGRYRLCFEIARGGMATVFLARAEGPGGFEKLVALKRIHEGLVDEQKFVDMFLDEARIASLISHPNVCSVFDFGQVDGTYFIAMEYLVGESLSRVARAVAEHPDPGMRARFRPIAIKIVADACEGLHAAHELRSPTGKLLRVVHRDVSPHNVMVTYDGSVRVVDFGIASAANRVHKTQTGEIKGKYAYMSPEQLRGDEVNRRTDVWALGVVLWELLATRSLFRRRIEPETLLAVVSEPIPSLVEVAPDVPDVYERIARSALSRDLAGRYADARTLGRDLMAALGEEGPNIGLADVADFMAQLFPEGRGRRNQLMELASQRATAIPEVHDGTTDLSMFAPAMTGPSRPLLTGPSTVPARTPRRGAGAEPVASTVAPPPARLRGIALAAVIGGLAALGVLGVLGVLGGDGRPEPVGVTEPAPAVEPPPEGPVEPPPEVVIAEPDRPEEGRDPHPAPEAPEPPGSVRVPARSGARPERQSAVASDPTPAAVRGTGEDAAGRSGAGEPATGSTGEPSAPRPHPPPGDGTVRIATPGGWATMRIDGRVIPGQTPRRLGLPAGEHVIELVPFGTGTPLQRRVVVEAGGDVRVVVPLAE